MSVPRAATKIRITLVIRERPDELSKDLKLEYMLRYCYQMEVRRPQRRSLMAPIDLATGEDTDKRKLFPTGLLKPT